MGRMAIRPLELIFNLGCHRLVLSYLCSYVEKARFIYQDKQVERIIFFSSLPFKFR